MSSSISSQHLSKIKSDESSIEKMEKSSDNIEKKFNVRFGYDYLEDIFYFRAKHKRYKESVLFDNLVFDIDEKDRIIGMEIFKISKVLNIPRYHLNRIKSMRFEVDVDRENIAFSIIMDIEIRNKISEKAFQASQPNVWNIAPTRLVSPVAV